LHASTGQLKATLDVYCQYFCVAWNNDGTKLATGGFDSVCIWSVGLAGTLECQSEFKDGLFKYGFFVALNNDGTKVAVGNLNRILMLSSSGTLERQSELEGHSDRVRGVCFSPDGSKLASCSDDRTVRIWNLITGECVSTYEHSYWYVVSKILFQFCHPIFTRTQSPFPRST